MKSALHANSKVELNLASAVCFFVSSGQGWTVQFEVLCCSECLNGFVYLDPGCIAELHFGYPFRAEDERINLDWFLASESEIAFDVFADTAGIDRRILERLIRVELEGCRFVMKEPADCESDFAEACAVRRIDGRIQPLQVSIPTVVDDCEDERLDLLVESWLACLDRYDKSSQARSLIPKFEAEISKMLGLVSS